MNPLQNPIDIALSEISESKHLLGSLLTASETFDYVGAKKALVKLEQKIRKLGKLQEKLKQMQAASLPRANVQVIDFSASGARAEAVEKPV